MAAVVAGLVWARVRYQLKWGLGSHQSHSAHPSFSSIHHHHHHYHHLRLRLPLQYPTKRHDVTKGLLYILISQTRADQCWRYLYLTRLYQYYTFLPRWRLILNKPGFLLWIYNCVIESEAEGGDGRWWYSSIILTTHWDQQNWKSSDFWLHLSKKNLTLRLNGFLTWTPFRNVLDNSVDVLSANTKTGAKKKSIGGSWSRFMTSVSSHNYLFYSSFRQWVFSTMFYPNMISTPTFVQQ